MSRLRSEAWLLRGISSLPGELGLNAGKLSFISTATGSTWPFQLRKLGAVLNRKGLAKAVEEGKPFQFFEWPAHEVRVSMPWYYFGGGIKFKYQDTELRFSFGRPVSTGPELADVAAELRELGAMRSRGKLWAKALSDAQARSSGKI